MSVNLFLRPKEKAKELYDKYEECYPNNYDKNGNNFFTDAIIKSASILVDEMIGVLIDLNGIYNITPALTYWEEVKKEIETLEIKIK